MELTIIVNLISVKQQLEEKKKNQRKEKNMLCKIRLLFVKI